MLTTCFQDYNFWKRRATAPCLNNNFRTGCHEDDLESFLRRMAEMPVASIQEMDKQILQEIKGCANRQSRKWTLEKAGARPADITEFL